MMVPNPTPPGLKISIFIFFGGILQPLCYVITFPKQDPASSLLSVFLDNFCSRSPNSIPPASDPAPSPIILPYPAPPPVSDLTPFPIPSHSPPPSSAPSPVPATIVLSPSLLSLPVLSSTAPCNVSNQEWQLPGTC